MSGKKILRKLAIAFGILMLFLAVDVSVAWYYNPEAQTPVQAVRLAATETAAQIIAHKMKAEIKKQKEAMPVAEPPPEQPAPQPDQPPEQPQAQPQSEKMTELDDVSAEGTVLVYTISIKANGSQFDFVMHALKSDLGSSGCSKPEYIRLMEYGFGIMLDFRSQDGTKEDSISFTPESCGFQRIVPTPQQAAQPPQQQEPPSQPQPDQQQPQPAQPQQ